MEKEQKEELVEPEKETEKNEDDSRFDKIYSNVASNRYENLRTSYIENKAKEMRKKKR